MTSLSAQQMRGIGLLLLLAFLLNACQTVTTFPIPRITPAIRTQTPQRSIGAPPPTRHPAQTPGSAPAIPAETPFQPADNNFDPAGLRGLVIDFWHPWSGDTAERVDELVKDFNDTNPWGLMVRARALLGVSSLVDAVESTQAEASGAGPEVVAAPSEFLAGWLDSGRLADLAPYLAHPEFGVKAGEQPFDLSQNFYPLYWQQDAFPDGARRSGIPALRAVRALAYNRSWAKKLGFDRPPTTPDQFKEQACAAYGANRYASDADLRGTGGWLVDGDPLSLLSWLNAFGASPVSADDTQPYSFQSQEGLAALDFLSSLMDKDCAWTGRKPTPYDYFARRMALFYALDPDEIAAQQNALAQAGNKDEWSLIPFPSVNGKPFVLAGGYSYGILRSKPEEQAAAWLFVRYLAQPRSQALLGEVVPSLPLGPAAARELQDYATRPPWSLLLPLQDLLAPAPAIASWRWMRPAVADAAWQVFRMPADQLQYVLPQLDELSKELSRHTQ